MLHCERDGFFFNWAVTAGWRPALRCRIPIESCAFSTRQWRNFTEHDSTLVRWWVLLRQKYSPRRKNLFWIGRSSQSSTSNQKIFLIIIFFSSKFATILSLPLFKSHPEPSLTPIHDPVCVPLCIGVTTRQRRKRIRTTRPPPSPRVRQSVSAFGGIIYTVPLERGGPWWLPVYASPSQP